MVFAPKNVSRDSRTCTRQLNLEQLKEQENLNRGKHTHTDTRTHTDTLKERRASCGSRATVGPVASCRDRGMKIEPIGNAGALEMCSLGRDMYNSCLNSSACLSLISPSPFSVITTNQFAQNLHKASERDGLKERAGRIQLRSVALLHITCIVLVHAIWILGVLHVPCSMPRAPFDRSQNFAFGLHATSSSAFPCFTIAC